MKKIFEDLGEWISWNFEAIMGFGLLGILAITFLSIPLILIIMLAGDFYTKNRALDIYEETGVMITIDSEDSSEIMKGEK